MRKIISSIDIRKSKIPKLFSAKKVPVFVISYNRKWQLERSLVSFRQLGDIEIIIHDNGSDDQTTIGYLKKLERNGITINWGKKIVNADGLNNVNNSIENYFLKHPECNYIVTDPDIELLQGAERTLKIYNFLLDKFPDVDCVGTMLKIDDISKDYPLYNNVINRHVGQFWQHKPNIIYFNNEPLAYIRCPIDSTFSMHRSGKKFLRKSDGIRLYGQYSAKHLDWYTDTDRILGDKYLKKSNPKIAHWTNDEFYREFKDDKLRFKTYFDVEVQGSKMKVVERKLYP